MAMFITYVFYFLIRMSDTASILLPLEYEGTLKDSEIVFLYTMTILNCFIIIQAFLKIMFFLRINEGFGLLVDLVSQALTDSIPFTVFLIMWIGLFSLLFRI